MAWFKVDDRAHSHPKVIAAGSSAFGLWARSGSYAADHNTNGAIPKAVARMYGSAAMARALVAAGLWHTTGHDCPRCEPVPTGDYVIHDYLDYNPSRADVEAEREAARQRMKRRRSADVRPNTDRTNAARSVGVRGPRPDPTRPGVPTEHPPPTPTGTQPAAASSDGEGDNLLTLVREITGTDHDQAAAVLDHIRDRHQPRSLSAYVRSMAARDTLRDVLTEMAPTPRRVRPKDEWMTRQ